MSKKTKRRCPVSFITLELVPECVCVEIPVSGGITQSVLRRSERWLLQSGDHQKALHYIARSKKEDRYRSLMDFLFCEIFIEFRGACFKHYLGGGPQLKDMVSKEELKRYDEIILQGLGAAYQIFCERRRLSWVSFRLAVLKAA